MRMRKLIVGLFALALLAGMVTPAFAVTGTSSHKKVVAAKPVFVSHPFTARSKYKAGRTFTTTGYVAPKASNLTSRTIEVIVYRQRKSGSWEQTATITGSLFNRRYYKNRTLYSAKVTLSGTGRYRMRTRYTWEAADGTKRVRYSNYRYFRIVK
jgi:hypothetical protein